MSSQSAKRNRLILILLATLAILGAAIFMLQQDKPQTAAQLTTSDTIDSISITRANFQPIELARTQDEWHMRAPYAIPANKQRIEPLLSLLTLPDAGYTQTEVDMDAAGLNNTDTSITLNDATFILGNQDITGERRYVLVNNKVSFVPEWVWSLINGGVTAFADLTVLPDISEPLFIEDNGNVDKLSNIDQWAALKADKIIALAPSSNAQKLEAPDYELQLAKSAEISDANNIIASIHVYSGFATVTTQPGFAYVIALESLAALLK
jgi:hypothetical protein